MPRRRTGGLDEKCGIGISPGTRLSGCHDRDQIRLLVFAVAMRRIAIEAGEGGNLIVGPARQKRELPSQHRGRNAQRAKRMARVVLTVPECALAVLPGFTPVN